MPHFAREKVDSKKQTKKFRKSELTNSLKTKKDGIQISNPTPKRISGWTSARKVTEGIVRADMGRMTGLPACSLEVSSSLEGRKNLLFSPDCSKIWRAKRLTSSN